MFTTHAGEAVFPCSNSCLAHHLREWFTPHPVPAQYDAGEFAGWLRGQIFEKVLMPDLRLSLHAWDARLISSTEDIGLCFGICFCCLGFGPVNMMTSDLKTHVL